MVTNFFCIICVKVNQMLYFNLVLNVSMTCLLVGYNMKRFMAENKVFNLLNTYYTKISDYRTTNACKMYQTVWSMATYYTASDKHPAPKRVWEHETNDEVLLIFVSINFSQN